MLDGPRTSTSRNPPHNPPAITTTLPRLRFGRCAFGRTRLDGWFSARPEFVKAVNRRSSVSDGPQQMSLLQTESRRRCLLITANLELIRGESPNIVATQGVSSSLNCVTVAAYLRVKCLLLVSAIAPRVEVCLDQFAQALRLCIIDRKSVV